jgi:ketosteroid isomerase-like protein
LKISAERHSSASVARDQGGKTTIMRQFGLWQACEPGMIYSMADFMTTLQHLTLENPWPLGGVLALAGVVLWIGAIHRGHRRQAVVAMTLWVLAAGVFILSAAITTEREVVTKQTNSLLKAATTPVDMQVIRSHLTADATLRGPDGALWIEFDQLPPEIETALQRWPVRQLVVRDMDVQVRGDLAIVTVQLSSRSSDDNFPAGTATRWRMQWRRQASAPWKLEMIQWIEWMGQPPPRNIWR